MNGRFKFALVASSTCIVVLLRFGAVRGRGAPAGDTPYTQLGVYTDVLPGEDISDRPAPEDSVPGLLDLIRGELPSGRYRVAELEGAAA